LINVLYQNIEYIESFKKYQATNYHFNGTQTVDHTTQGAITHEPKRGQQAYVNTELIHSINSTDLWASIISHLAD